MLSFLEVEVPASVMVKLDDVIRRDSSQTRS